MAQLTARFLKMLRESGVTYYRDADGTVLRLAPAAEAIDDPAPASVAVLEERRPRRRKGEEIPVSADDDRAALGLPPALKPPPGYEVPND